MHNDSKHNDSTNLSAALSRRSLLLQGIICAAAVPTAFAVGTNAAMAAKLPQASVSYRPKPNGTKKCSNCMLFEPPNACKSVAGNISPNGWCSIWRAKS